VATTEAVVGLVTEGGVPSVSAVVAAAGRLNRRKLMLFPLFGAMVFWTS